MAKQFVKALDPGGEAFQEICLLFPKLSESKVQDGVFPGPQVRKMLRSEKLENVMSAHEREIWCTFRDIVNDGFLANNKHPNYK